MGPRTHLVQHAGGSFCGFGTSLRASLSFRCRRCELTPMEIGGGFGGKIPVYLEPVAAVLSKKSGRPGKDHHDAEGRF